MTNNKIKCVAIDDEPIALDIISDYCAKISFLDLLSTFRDGLQAIEFLQKNDVDLIFLDINMPEINGIDFYKSLHKKPNVIFTTAYSEFAVESYDLNAVDYLLKPISFDRFLKAVNKCHCEQYSNNDSPLDTSIILKSGSKSYQVNTNEIMYVEGSGNYLTFHLSEKKIMVLMNMNQALEILPDTHYARIHKSYIVALNAIKIIENHQVQINDDYIPIGKFYKESFLMKVKQNKN